MPDENDETRTAPPPPPTGHYEPNLEPGLAAAFGEPTPGGWSQPPLLRDDPSEHAPLVQPGSPEVPRGGAERYQLLGEIARGGMGVVLKGRDPDLGRDLAFKVLRTELAGKPAAVQRFVEEAQVGGQLQHPGVVPVYDLGRFADGRPYFAMKLVKGRTLADLLAERASPAAERGRYLHAFLQVCHTLAYAHSKGVIHRDLKPSNVMVGAFGEVLVMDWGLAKVLPRGGVADELKAQPRARAPVAEEPTVIHTARAGSGGSETQAGSVMGTPAFMPPEQAGGEIDKLDERADVFGLGAVLCVILTGAPPYVAETADATRLMAVRGELDECLARLGASGTDAELMDLCKRCLAPKREARPRHAGEVAGELAEYLAAVEQRAHAAEVERAAAAAEAREQRKRRKAQAVLGGLVTLVVLVGAATATWLWQRAEAERRNTREALDRLTEEQTRTLAALNAMTDEGIERLFQAQPEVSDEQRVFIDKVTALYEQATRANLETPAGRAARGDGLYRVGRLRLRLDDHAGGARELHAAIELQTALLAEFPNNVEYRFALARSRAGLALIHQHNGLPKEAEAEFRGCLAEFSRIGAENAPPGYLTELGRTHHNFARLLQSVRNSEAVAQSRAAVAALRRASERDPDSRTTVSMFVLVSAGSTSFMSSPDESIRVLTEGLAFAEPYRARFGADQTFLRGYLLLRQNLSVSLSKVKKYAAAEAEARVARDGYRDLANRYPGVKEFRRSLAESQVIYAQSLADQKRSPEAFGAYQGAGDAIRRALQDAPDDRYLLGIGIAVSTRLGNYAAASSVLQLRLEALTRFEEALGLIERARKVTPDDLTLLLESALARDGLGRALRTRVRDADAVQEYRRALADLELYRRTHDDTTSLNLRAQVKSNLALSLQTLQRDAQEVERAYRDALADWEAVVTRDAKNYALRDWAARCQHEIAKSLFNRGLREEAEKTFRAECDLRTRLVADAPTPPYREALGEAHSRLGLVLQTRDRNAEAEREFVKAVAVLRPLVTEFPKVPSHKRHLADAMSRLSFQLTQQGRYEEVEKLTSEAQSYFTEVALTEVAGNRVFQQVRAQTTGYLAGARAHRGDHRAANQLLSDMVAQDPSSALTHYNAACVLGNCVLAAGRDPQLTDMQRKELTGQYTDRAIGYLRSGMKLDREDREYSAGIPTDKDLDPFRDHPEFKKLMAEIASWPARAPAPREVKR